MREIKEEYLIKANDTNAQTKLDIMDGRTSLGIEFGSTRIKTVLVGSDLIPIATGSYEWENKLEKGIWTYSLDDIWKGLRVSYRKMAAEVFEEYGETISEIGSIGFSAMMHGYMAFDQNDELLVPFRTWRNAITEEASKRLTKEFQYNIPQRWSIAHLYQAILNKEEHIKHVKFLTTLAGYIHWQLTGKKVLGIGDASGMFPINIQEKNYHQKMVQIFNDLIRTENVELDLNQILPKILLAGDRAGVLTQEGAYLIDPTGLLKAGIPLCPPEGDAGTGMVATNSIAKRTGNISAGTSAFAMIVLEENLKDFHSELDLVTTPTGELVAMVHTNNCSSELNAWVRLFKEFTETLGLEISTDRLYNTLLTKALQGEANCGGLLSYGYYSGENIVGLNEGRPLMVRSPDSKFDLANFMRLHLSSAFGAMRMGMEILKKENIKIDKLVGHGGIFKTPVASQSILASAMEVPITVMDTAGDGGPWGIALLAAYMIDNNRFTLEHYLKQKVFISGEGVTIVPKKEDIEGYASFIELYKNGLSIEKEAIKKLKSQK